MNRKRSFGAADMLQVRRDYTKYQDEVCRVSENACLYAYAFSMHGGVAKVKFANKNGQHKFNIDRDTGIFIIRNSMY